MKSNQKSVLLYAHTGSLNRGCEAIIRSTADLLAEQFDHNLKILCTTGNVTEDLNAQVSNIDRFIIHDRYKRWSPAWIFSKVIKKTLNNRYWAEKITNRSLLKKAQLADVWFSVGGDNYCYQRPYWLYTMDQELKKQNKKLVLWGCSIEPATIDEQMENDLKLFDLITARESITYNALVEHGINHNTQLLPDPAFTMETQELQLPENWQIGNMIGINISPLIMKYESSLGVVLNAMNSLVEHILNSTNNCIAFIPHVTWAHTNDLEPLTKLYEEFKDSKRVVLIGEGYNAPQLKGFISRCRMFVGARTHATIAAYSSNVPTLVLGYSVKARGIARDIFGDETGLVVPVQELENDKQLINAFECLRGREEELRNHLQKTMPGYIASAREAAKHVARLLEEK